MLGLVIRELLAPWTGHPYDFEIWARLGFYMQSLGNPYRTLPYIPGVSFSPYPIVGSISYPPFSAFIFAVTYRFYLLLGEPSRFLYYFLLKQPMVLADVGIAVMLARIALLTGSDALARRAPLVWIYLPFGIVISTLWGQLDPIALFLSLVSIYYFLTSRWLFSALMLGLGIYLKTGPLVFLPVLLFQDKMVGRLRYSLLALSIPALGTLVPATVLNWGYLGAYRNISYQAMIPSQGAMSIFAAVSLPPSLPGPIASIRGSVWIATLLASYIYIYRKRLPLFQGLLIAALVFGISRPFLPEQWSLYPLAFLLLQEKDEIGHFIGLSVTALSFVAANNTLLVRFFSPLSTQAFYWDTFITTQSSYAVLRTAAMDLFAIGYFCEAVLVILGRQSIINRLIMSTRPAHLLQQHIAPTEACLA